MVAGLIRLAFFGAVGVLIALQAIPYGHDHANPPVQMEPRWDSPETRVLAVRACYDCHSNETIWPWYSNVAPMSWLIQRDVEEGRHKLNFSEWDREQEAEDAAETVQKGKMPPAAYLLLHPEAKLTSTERQALIQGFLASLGGVVDRQGGGRKLQEREQEEREEREEREKQER